MTSRNIILVLALKIRFLLLPVWLITACKGQDRVDPPSVQTDPAFNFPVDVDPFFSETQTINSSIGPNSITRNIIEDKNGNIWLATWEGILRYSDGTFTNFTNKAGLRKFHAFAVMEESTGDLWFGTIGAGVYRYDGEKFINFTTKDGLLNDRVSNLSEDSSGNIWIGSEGGISRYDGKSFTNFTTADGLTANDINDIVEDKNGLFWIGTRGQACTWNGETFSLITNEEGDSFSNVRSILEDRNGNIWLGGNGGLWRYDGRSWANFTKTFVGYIHEDSNGNIWTSSGVGNWALTRYEGTSLSPDQVKSTELSVYERMYFGILEDSHGDMWFGKLDGVYRYDGESFEDFK
ncbi:MAG: hypothetical protein KTR30_36445 [Saprospiraceae bacterium]|nr:hypothetical protein [Saprospiraceae bacterium]